MVKTSATKKRLRMSRAMACMSHAGAVAHVGIMS